MILRLSILSLFFTLIPSLASSQWESDQFLFNHSNRKARLKSNHKNNKNTSTKGYTRKNEIPDFSPTNNPNNLDIENKPTRELASNEVDVPIVLNLKLGLLNANSASLKNESDFKKESILFYGDVNFFKKNEDEFTLFYSSTTEFKTSADIGTRLELWGGAFKWKVEAFDGLTKWGVILKQNSWWGSKDNAEYSLKHLNSLGLSGVISIPKLNTWNSKIDLQIIPKISNEKNSLSGNSFEINWSGSYSLSPVRSLILSIGHEWVELQGKPDVSYNMKQNLLKISVGYKLSNSD